MVIIFILINYGATILQTLLDASLGNRLPDIFIVQYWKAGNWWVWERGLYIYYNGVNMTVVV